jgi:hypothetical protein
MGYTENGTEPARGVGWAGRPRGVSAAVRPDFSLERAFLTSFFGQKILREV